MLFVAMFVAASDVAGFMFSGPCFPVFAGTGRSTELQGSGLFEK